ncbi:DNA excision repair protein ERCC-6-like [Echeneis naucrates]|uniref:DNA excision repair protein ERCC-6-like n=1 Tax=Echeneis naucrates TaxID=173247 RepID=UPI001113C4ED|nr:DNA excision repair protein ERCC-6-like [Echeneis naucrates]
MEAPNHDGEVREISQKLKQSLSVDTDDWMESYSRFIHDGKTAAREGDLLKALKFLKLAHNLQRSDKLESRIKKIEALIAEDESEEEDEFVNVNNSGLLLYKDLHDKLYDYQRDGVAFLYSLYRDGRKGGILADDMGLGKTIQVISFLSGMYDNNLVKHTLLVMPTSLITNWTKEFAKWTPGMRVKEFHGISKGERTWNLEKVQRRGGIIITTYTMLLNNWQQLSTYHGSEFKWDYIILDEAHKIKSNTTKTAKSAYAIPSNNQILLTGTPVQNNLREMWALFDFACRGTLLGTAKTFKAEYENPITRAREKDATPGEKALGFRMSENLMAIIKPYFLRRTKAEVQKKKTNSTYHNPEEDPETTNNQVANGHQDSGAVMPALTRKNDLIVWTYLSAVQENIYKQFISLDHIKELLLTTKSPLAELNILKKLCDHPRLLSAAAIAKLGLGSPAEHQHNHDMESDMHSITHVPDDTLISESGKLVFLFALLEQLRHEGHRTLVFAHYRKVLDILEHILGKRGFKVLRLDGTITQIAERQRRITLFQTDKRYSVFLLTTQVGGVGITLTAANRVVIYDPSWNPATDAQAVDRAYRIGQTENVVIYRLITCGTVEEKIYRRQIFKESLIRQNTGDKKDPFRYFSKQELKELFTLEDARSSSTQLQLQALHSRHRKTDAELDEHIAHLHTMEMFGISDHDLMYSLDVPHNDAIEDQQEQDYIEGRVQKAQELMKAESDLQMQLVENMALSTEPAWLRQPGGDSHEKKPRSPRPSPSYPQHDTNRNWSPVLVELDNSGSVGEHGQQNESNHVINVSSDDSMTEQPAAEHQDLDSPKKQSMWEDQTSVDSADVSSQELTEKSVLMLKAAGEADASRQELMDQSSESEAGAGEADASRQELMDQSSESEAGAGEADASSKELMDQSSESEAGAGEADASRQELMDRSSESEAGAGEADASRQELMDRSAASEAAAGEADASRQELMDQSAASEAAAGEADASRQELMDRSAASEAAVWESRQLYVTDENKNQELHGAKHSKGDNSEPDLCHITPLHMKKLSILNASESSFKADASFRVGDGLESFEGNFNLQLEDSDAFSDGGQDPEEMEEGERWLLSQLQLQGSFSVDKSLSEQQQAKQSLNNGHASSVDESANGSFVVAKKKRAAVIYDSDEEEQLPEQLENSFKVGGSSTPKSVPSDSTPLQSRKSAGGNISVASRRSFLLSIFRGGKNHMQDDDDEAEEEDIVESSPETEEPTGETLNTEEEEEEEEEEDYPESPGISSKTGEDMSSNLEQSTGELELASTERMDECTVQKDVVASEEQNYDFLVSSGKECYSKGELDEALDYFLRAIDIKPGDPEIQLMTIQLYRRLSQRK